MKGIFNRQLVFPDVHGVFTLHYAVNRLEVVGQNLFCKVVA